MDPRGSLARQPSLLCKTEAKEGPSLKNKVKGAHGMTPRLSSGLFTHICMYTCKHTCIYIHMDMDNCKHTERHAGRQSYVAEKICLRKH